MKTLSKGIVGLLLVFGQHGLAEQITFGPEFEFSHPRMHWIDNPIEMIKTGYNYPGAREQRELKKFADAVTEKCKIYQCRVEEVPGKWDEKGAKTYRVTFADGWFFSITPDAWVVEITAAPITLQNLKIKQSLLDEMIFNTAKEIDLDSRGSDVFGGLFGKAAGHVNFGTRSAFGDDGKEWLRYFADYANYPELAGGAMQKDIINAPGFATLGEAPSGSLQNIIRDVNSGMQLTPAEAAHRVLQEVYTTSPVMKSEANHYQAVGIKHVAKIGPTGDLPTEHRAVMSQRSTEEFILMAELITARVNFLKSQASTHIVLTPYRKIKWSKKDLVSSYYLYTTEVGMNFQKYRALLRPELQNIEPDLFVQGIAPRTTSEANDFIHSILFHLPKLAHSPLVQERFKWILKDPRLAEQRPWVIDLILTDLKKETRVEYSNALLQFLKTVKQTTPMYKNLVLPTPAQPKAMRCQSLY